MISNRQNTYVGDALGELRKLPDESVHCCVTSPPYWGLRDYGVEPIEWPDGWSGCLGLEPTPDLYVEHLVAIFREVKRVLRKDGTLWLNLGDSYAGYWGEKYAHKPFGKDRTPDKSTPPNKPSLDFKSSVIKPKDLIGIPWQVAFALRNDGWYLRMDIIWSKPNPLPESVRDRPTKAHEYMFLLAKSTRYFYDPHAIKEQPAPQSLARIRQANFAAQTGGPKDYRNTGINTNRSARRTLENFAKNPSRNKRSVWHIPVRPYRGAHFAVMAPELVEPCIKAGTSEKGCCPECGAPWRRVIEEREGGRDKDTTQRTTDHYNTKERYGAGNCGNSGLDKLAAKMRDGIGLVSTGWQSTCACYGVPILEDRPKKKQQSDAEYVESMDQWRSHWEELKPQYDELPTIPCTVLDPFAGAFTTPMVARRLGRRFIAIELNEDYALMGLKRIYHDMRKPKKSKKPKKPPEDLDEQYRMLETIAKNAKSAIEDPQRARLVCELLATLSERGGILESKS